MTHSHVPPKPIVQARARNKRKGVTKPRHNLASTRLFTLKRHRVKTISEGNLSRQDPKSWVCVASRCYWAEGEIYLGQVVDEIWEEKICRKCAQRKVMLDACDTWRRRCGCIKTSDKLRSIIESFPAPPPPSPVNLEPSSKSTAELQNAATCISAFCAIHQSPFHADKDEHNIEEPTTSMTPSYEKEAQTTLSKRVVGGSWAVVTELVQLVQLSVTATALALYYLIFCYMQLVYYTLRSALYFHNADGPMKVTIGVVTLTSLIVGFNLLLRIERLVFGLLE